MLRMIDKEYIKKTFSGRLVHSRTQSTIVKISRQTVRKMLKEGEIPK